MDQASTRPAADEDDPELFFEDFDLDALATIEAVTEPAAASPPPEVKPARRRRAQRGEEAAEPVPEPAPLPLPTLPSPADPADTLPDPLQAVEPAPVAPALPRLVLVALVLAAVASLFSAIGLLVASRTIAAAAVARDEAAGRAAVLKRLDSAVAEVEALARAQRQSVDHAGGTTPVTAADLDRGFDALRQSLGRSQAPGTTALAGAVRQGQAELSNRMDDLEARIDAISARATRAARH